ncbi:hypothetical protein [Parapedobacter tibetensis]|uniref:hypothetical protein n=1 Tax=Parapedobacter tibetensis TaxID=2972951 RepID=UPI00214D940E|nr:hypothetical protein [Parapedobacter tibetensis]
MHLAFILKKIPIVLFLLFSCGERMELYPWQCHCDIEATQLSKPGFVTYQVSANGNAVVSSVTYQTSDGRVTIHNPVLPFDIATQMDTDETVLLTTTGNPGKGNIILTYEIQNHDDESGAISGNMSRVWVLRNGNCH